MNSKQTFTKLVPLNVVPFKKAESTKNRINFDFHGRKIGASHEGSDDIEISGCFPPTFPPVFLAKYRITATTRKWEKDSQQKFLVSCSLLERVIYVIYTGGWKYYSLNDVKRTKDKLTYYRILSPKNYSHYWTITESKLIFSLYIYIYFSLMFNYNYSHCFYVSTHQKIIRI